MRIYNLFPLLAGSFDVWQPHLVRAAEMGFNWVFVNPVQRPGASRSLYSIADYFQINPVLVKEGASSPEAQVKAMNGEAHALGLKTMVDLVINHCAYDSDLLKQHPNWFLKENGNIAHPFCLHEGEKVVWQDLAQFDYPGTPDREGLYAFCKSVVAYLLDLGFSGFRCDAAYQIPAEFWRRLIRETQASHPDAVFVAETLGCSAEQTRQTAQAGFDAIFNSSKWWDFESPWLLEQYQLTRAVTRSIGFPESHDTPRLFAETHGNVDALKQRYLFAALFSAGVMIPMGFEFGFTKPLHVVETRPSDWEETEVDLTAFIREVNHIKGHFRVFREESITHVWNCGNPAVLLLWKASQDGASQALVLLNKDIWNRQQVWVDDLYRYVEGGNALVDVSPQWPMEYLPIPFEFELLPGMARVIVAGGESWEAPGEREPPRAELLGC